MKMPFQSFDTLLFIGDSITDCGRVRPLGETAGLGNGYVALVNAALGSRHPETVLRVLNTGISGNRVTDLDARWQSDVLDLAPDWLSIMIGINDVWRQFDHAEWGHEKQVGPEQFERILGRLVGQTRKKVKGIFLLTPFFIELDKRAPMRARMDEYGAIVKTIAGDNDCQLVDTQAAFDRYLEGRPSDSLAHDRVHPNLTGHQILADAFLEAC